MFYSKYNKLNNKNTHTDYSASVLRTTAARRIFIAFAGQWQAQRSRQLSPNNNPWTFHPVFWLANIPRPSHHTKTFIPRGLLPSASCLASTNDLSIFRPWLIIMACLLPVQLYSC